jgi:predicted AlkP superfamily pyrophosphatase or phosphodiesterase
MHSSFLKPRYPSHCFSALPAAVRHLLTGLGPLGLAKKLFGGLPTRYDTVLLFFVDAFGWRFFEQYADDYPFLKRFVKDGVVSKITSQFPSTTAAHVTTIHTGLPIGQSGVFEWQYYEPQVDALIAPLLFSFAGTRERDTLRPARIAPASLYPARTLYRDLQRLGVTSHIFQSREYTPSTFSDIVFQGANVVPYKTIPEAFVNLGQALEKRLTPAYFFLYFDKIDALMHDYGPASPQAAAEIDGFLTNLERLFFKPTLRKLKRTLFIFTADHGQMEVSPQTTIYLNQRPEFAGVERFLKTNARGELLVPAGSPRDLFLYVHADLLDEARHFFAQRLAGRADVCQTQTLIARGFFGPQPVSPQFLARVGNLVILPYESESVWWYEPGKFEMKFLGHHGGLTKQEMEIPLLLYTND